MKGRLLGIVLAFAVPCSVPGQSPLTGEQILRQAVEIGKQQDALREQYLYRDHVEILEWKRDGSSGRVLDRRDFEVFYLEGFPYRRLTAINGKPLTGEQEAAEVEKLKMTAAERRAALTQGRRKFFSAGNRPEDILRLLSHVLAGEEMVGGRKAWVVRSEAGKDAAAAPASGASVLCYRYTSWIDQESGVIAQQDFEVVRKGVDTEPGTKSRAVYSTEDGSPWFLRSMEGKFILKRADGEHRSVERHTTSGFRQFSAESALSFEPEQK